jgi:tRNA-dihydrouridine synthase B
MNNHNQYRHQNQGQDQSFQYIRPIKIGSYQTINNLFVAPMAGVTDRPFRLFCKKWGAGHTVSEMMSSNPQLKDSIKTQKRASHEGEQGLIAVQIVGSDGAMMAETAIHNIKHGAHIIDINMGCPARKVCNVASGSALLKDEKKVYDILKTLTSKVWQEYPNTPITLKTRTGWCPNTKNAVTIAKMAQDLGCLLYTSPSPRDA